jgi:hypothetical protein
MTSPAFCRYQCPDCGGKFRWLFADPPPLFCPLCAAYVGEDESDEFVPKAPAIRTAANQIPDQLFRNMEQSSIERADQARELAGGDRADYSHMHITNMKDNLREGDVAAIVPPNPVRRFMEQHPQTPIGAQSAQTAQGFAAAAHADGIAPHAGAGAAGQIQNFHMQSARAMQARGEIARG